MTALMISESRDERRGMPSLDIDESGQLFVATGDAKAHAMKRRLWDISHAVLPRTNVFDFNQALMDFGATVCTARNPKCDACPMRPDCALARRRQERR